VNEAEETYESDATQDETEETAAEPTSDGDDDSPEGKPVPSPRDPRSMQQFRRWLDTFNS
jgi:hypothetical protein